MQVYGVIAWHFFLGWWKCSEIEGGNDYTSCKIPAWMKHKLESRLLEEMSITSNIQMTPPLWQKMKRSWRASWWKWNEESEKVGLKLNIQKMKIMASSPITSQQIDGETMETVTDYVLGLQNPCRWWLQPWN